MRHSQPVCLGLWSWRRPVPIMAPDISVRPTNRGTVPEVVTTFLGQLEGWILALAASGWVFPAMFGFATIDGFFPPLPSESVIITLSVSAYATGVPWLPGILLTAMAGAWCGDQIAYLIGRSIGTERIPYFRTGRGRRTVEWARHALNHRGGSFILAARYVPVGRVAVNMSAGALGYPRKRFMVYSGIAAITWAFYSMLIGLAAASWLGHEPLLAMVVGVVVGIVVGVVLDQVVQRLTRRGRRVGAVTAPPAQPTAHVTPAQPLTPADPTAQLPTAKATAGEEC
jgi:membrane-associated protein